MRYSKEVAGLGAFKTEIKLPLILISKSCSNEPFGFINCALTPAGEDLIISSLISGINFCRSFRNIDLKIDLNNSPEVVIGYFFIKFQIP